MVTGRRIEAATGGHGVTWNDDRRRRAPSRPRPATSVESVFTVVDDAGGSPRASSPARPSSRSGTARGRCATDTRRSSRTTRRWSRAFKGDLGGATRAFRLLHLSEPDVVGHAQGFMGPAYLRAVAAGPTAGWGASSTCCARPDRYAGHTTVILTADHGGRGDGPPRRDLGPRLPRAVRGVGQRRGPGHRPLRRSTPTYAEPGRARTTYDDVAGPQRQVANLALDLLGLPAVPDSEHDAAQDLDVSAADALTARSGNGHGLNRQPSRAPSTAASSPAPADPAPGSHVSAPEPVPGLVVDHEVAVVAQRLPVPAFHAGEASFHRSWLITTKRPTRHDQYVEQVAEKDGSVDAAASTRVKSPPRGDPAEGDAARPPAARVGVRLLRLARKVATLVVIATAGRDVVGDAAAHRGGVRRSARSAPRGRPSTRGRRRGPGPRGASGRRRRARARR